MHRLNEQWHFRFIDPPEVEVGEVNNGTNVSLLGLPGRQHMQPGRNTSVVQWRV